VFRGGAPPHRPWLAELEEEEGHHAQQEEEEEHCAGQEKEEEAKLDRRKRRSTAPNMRKRRTEGVSCNSPAEGGDRVALLTSLTDR
jgi:hypothetical protein